jgi:hypothetical protein
MSKDAVVGKDAMVDVGVHAVRRGMDHPAGDVP